MKRTRWPLLAALMFGFIVHAWTGATLARAEAPATAPADAATQFTRFVPDHQGGGILQTAIVTYHNDAGVIVHLVAAVHVAEKGYYAALNDTFAHYDALLYEMVKPKEMGPPKPGFKSHSTVSGIQRLMTQALDLDFQLDDIDYSRPNFIHADLDAETFVKMQDDRGESMLSIMLHSMVHQMERDAEGKASKAPPMTLFDLMAALRAPDKHRALKLLFAEQFNNIEDDMSGLTGPNGSVIITERNKKCLATLDKAMADGHKDIGIFYGAAHMADMSARLKARGFKQTGIEWRTSWDMRDGHQPPAR